MTVSFRVLGPLRGEVGGAPVDLGGRRQRAVLARLAVADGQVVSADTLVEDLWPDEATPKALAALQVAISHLRRILEPERRPRTPATVLVSVAPGYALVLPPDGLDSRRFAALLDEAAALPAVQAEVVLGDALALWSGPAYAEFADTAWAGPEAARLTELRLGAVERRGRARIDMSAAGGAVPDLERLVHDHPLRESAVALLALALYLAGRQADALAVLAKARRRLVDELGVDPGPELRAVERDILGHAIAPQPPLVPASASGFGRVAPATTAAEPLAGRPAEPLVGRAGELARLRTAAENAAARRVAGVVLVSADAGGGKTALVQALRAEVEEHGWTVALGRCPEVDGAPPGWAWREIVEQLGPAPLPDGLRPLIEPGGGQAAAEQIFWVAQALTGLVATAATTAPLLLVLDDLHRAEGETLQLLRSVVGGLAGVPVLVVATLRPAEVGPDLATALAALAGPITDRIELGGLPPEAVADLLTRHGATTADAATAALVGERTGGNPLFVRELARLIATDGAAAAAEAVPAGVRDVLRRRLARLPAPAQTVLRHAAVLGRDVDVDALVAIVGDEDGALDALELGVLSGLLSEPPAGSTGEDRVRFTHALVRDTLYSDVPRLRRARLHAAALDAIATLPAVDPAILAHHALAAGGSVPAERSLPLVVDAARSAGAPREAAALWASAIELAGPARLDLGAETQLRIAHVSALAHGGAVRQAMAARDTAIGRTLGSDHLVGVLTSYDAPAPWSIRTHTIVEPQRVGLIEEALAAGPEPVLRARLLATLTLETESGDDVRAERASAEAMAITGVDERTRCAVLNARGFCVNGPDRRREMDVVAAELAAIATRAGFYGYRSLAHHYEFMLATEHLRFEEAQQHAEAAVAVAPAGQLGFALGWSRIWSAMRMLLAGDLDGAEAAYVAAAEAMVASGEANGYTAGLVGTFAVRHARGDVGSLAEEMLAIVAYMPPTVSDFVAATLVAAGRVPEAEAVWHPEVEPTRTYYWQLWMVVRAAAAIGLGNREVAARCHAELLPWAGTLAGVSSGSITLGPVDETLAALAEFLGRPLAERDAHLRGALALATRVGQPQWTARIRRALAADVG